ncbi:MAG: ATP-binding protein [Promethearchaeota archaeon]
MTIINVTLPMRIIKGLSDYSKIVNEVLKQEISFNILKFSTDSSGIKVLLDVPEDKIKDITESLKKSDIVVNKKGRVVVDKELCIDCGACVSLCPTDALKLNENFELEFADDLCIGCNLCINSCPRYAIIED